MEATLRRWAESRGYAVAWGPVEAVFETREEIAARHARGELDETFYRSELEPMSPPPAAGLPTVVVVARPDPAHTVHFEIPGRRLDTLLPPTYVSYRATFEAVRQDLSREGLPGARVEHLGWPLKAVAARLGLVRYGRNNITYTDGFGSYVQLCGYVTDALLPAPRGGVAAPALLDECASCTACVSACPTGAIVEERTLLRAERCLTFANERPDPWPAGLSPRAHNCLIGCLLCQQGCPANPPLPAVDTGVTFSAEETAMLLSEAGAGEDRTESGIRAKLAWLGVTYPEAVIARNLRALLAAG